MSATNRPSRSFRRGVSLAMRTVARFRTSHVLRPGDEFATEVRGLEPRFEAAVQALDPDGAGAYWRATVRRMEASIRRVSPTSGAKRAMLAHDYAEQIRRGNVPNYIRQHVRRVFLPNARHAVAMADACMADSLRVALAKVEAGQW